MSGLERKLDCGIKVHKADSLALHRGKPFDKFLALGRTDRVIDGIRVAAICIGNEWFVVANQTDDEAHFPDLGPFSTPELALMCIRPGKD